MYELYTEQVAWDLEGLLLLLLFVNIQVLMLCVSWFLIAETGAAVLVTNHSTNILQNNAVAIIDGPSLFVAVTH